MKITGTIELNDSERVTVSRFLKICSYIAEIASCSMLDVYKYIECAAEITKDGYSISAEHHISNISEDK